MYLKEHKYTEWVKYSVPIGEREDVHVDAQPDMENCANGIAPQPNATADGVRRMKVALLLKKVQGTWLITDVFMTGEVIAFAPIFFWKRIRRGISDTLTKLLIGWRCLTRALAEKAVGA